MSDFFKFEDENTDIPFYKGNPRLSLLDWGVVVFALVLSIVLLNVRLPLNSSEFAMLIFLVLTLPALYICHGKWDLFFRKPKRGDIKLIVLCLVGYYVYTFVITGLLGFMGLETNPSGVLDSNMDLLFWITTLCQLMGEEFFKILMFIVFVALTYHFTKDRKISIYVGLVVICLAFGLVHYNAYGSLAQILLIQGLGSLFEMYAYLKTKNVVVTYLLHVIMDAIPFILVTLINMYGIVPAAG